MLKTPFVVFKRTQLPNARKYLSASDLSKSCPSATVIITPAKEPTAVSFVPFRMKFHNQHQGTLMPRKLTEAGERAVAEVAARHSVSADAISTLLQAIIAGEGRQAQFNHPELGGMGQWSSGGMLMIGDMFNNGLKAKVGVLADELARAATQEPALVEPAKTGSHSAEDGLPFGWPDDLGTPSSTGSQNDMHYAVFPQRRRLAIVTGGRMSVYDTTNHHISGLAQQQGPDQSLILTSPRGPVPLSSLKQVYDQTPLPRAPENRPVQPEAAQTDAPSSEAASPTCPKHDPLSQGGAIDGHDAIFSKIEGLADLYDKNIITADEYTAKKAELLNRL